MPLIDWIIAGTVVGATGGILATRAIRTVSDFRLQQRTTQILTETVTALENLTGGGGVTAPRRDARPAGGEPPQAPKRS